MTRGARYGWRGRRDFWLRRNSSVLGAARSRWLGRRWRGRRCRGGRWRWRGLGRRWRGRRDRRLDRNRHARRCGDLWRLTLRSALDSGASCHQQDAEKSADPRCGRRRSAKTRLSRSVVHLGPHCYADAPGCTRSEPWTLYFHAQRVTVIVKRSSRNLIWQEYQDCIRSLRAAPRDEPQDAARERAPIEHDYRGHHFVSAPSPAQLA